MSRELDNRLDKIFNELKGSDNKKSELPKKQNLELAMENASINARDDFDLFGSEPKPIYEAPKEMVAVKFLPQDQTEFKKLNAREWYYKKLSEISDIKDTHFMQPVKINGIDPSLSVSISLGELKFVMVNAQGVKREGELSQIYRKVFSGSEPTQDLLNYNNAQDDGYMNYLYELQRQSEASMAKEPEPSKINEVDPFDFEATELTPKVESEFVKVAKDILGDDSIVTVDAEVTTVSTVKRRGRPSRKETVVLETKETTEPVVTVTEVNDDRGYFEPIESKNDGVKEASLLSDDTSRNKAQTGRVTRQDIEGFTRVIQAIIRKFLEV